jgi:hypothetical protein
MNDPRNPIRIDPEALEALATEADDESDERPLTREELAWELVEVLDDLNLDEMRELVAKNVPSDSIEFFERYAREFSEGLAIDKAVRARLPNLMLLGYLLRVLEDRLLEPDALDA